MKILIFLLFTNIFIFAQTNKDSNADKKSVENIKANSSDTINEKNVYKFLYEETKQTNDRMVSTVYWSLGGVLALALFLMGYNAFYNFKINKDQIGAINKEFENKIEKVRNEDAHNLNVKLEENKKEYEDKLTQNYEYINSELDSKITSLTVTYEKQTKAYKESNELQVKTLEKSIEERVNNVNKGLEVLSEQFTSKHEDQDKRIQEIENKITNKINNEISSLNFKTSLAEGKLWEIAKVPINTLRAYMRTLEVEMTWSIPATVAPYYIMETLKNMEFVDKEIKDRIIYLLNKAANIEDIRKKEILDKLNSIKVK